MPCLKWKGGTSARVPGGEDGREDDGRQGVAEERGGGGAMGVLCGLLAALADRLACGKHRKKRQVSVTLRFPRWPPNVIVFSRPNV